MLPRPDVIWTAGGRELAPFVWAQARHQRRPIVLDLDWTLAQQEDLAPTYFSRPAKDGWRYRVAERMERLVWRNVTMFNAWSNWAADSLRKGGIDSSQIVVNPPGVDLERFRPQPRSSYHGGPLRLLFIGGDFIRKGGDLLLSVMRTRLQGRAVLDVVTREQVAQTANVRVHRAEPNSSTLTDLLAQADLFVMPTRAECFGIATVEAMASGLPAIVGNVGAAPEIVQHGVTGWLVEPREAHLAQAIEFALDHHDMLPDMGLHARRIAEENYNGERNDARVVQTIRLAHEVFHAESSSLARNTASRAS
jgi:glycosyltransferase involved in cell wall biosynthesis